MKWIWTFCSKKSTGAWVHCADYKERRRGYRQRTWASGGLGAGCVMRKEELKCTTTHRGTDSPHPWQKRGPGASCGGRCLSRGMCEGPRAGGWRQRNSSLNENIKSKIRISPSSAAGVEDAVGGGLWTGGLAAPAWVHVQPVFSRYSATIRVSTALNSPRCSQLLKLGLATHLR